MAGYRKLGRTSSQRKAMLRSLVTALLFNGKIVTTEARAKEVKKIAEGLIALAVKEKDNFETVKVTAKVARKDENGKRVKEVVDGKKVTVYDEVEKEIKKDKASRLHARRQMLKVLYDVTDVPTARAGKKKNTKKVDMPAKLFDELAPKYANRNGGYSRIVKIGQRKGDGAMEVLLELLAGALSLRHIIGQIFPLNCLAHLPRGIDIAHLSGIPHLTVTFLDGITCRLLHLFVILTGAQRS